MSVTAILFIVTLCCVCMTNAHFAESKFLRYKDYGPVSASAAVTLPSSSSPISCASACLRRNSCWAFSMYSSTCSLYDTYMDDPASQLQHESGQVFFNFAMKEKVSVTTENIGQPNGGWANFFPQLKINKVGRVVRWQVRCGTAGVVVLAIWRGDVPSSGSSPITLIGKHYITVLEGMQDQLVTYDVPVEENLLVEAGDFVGFHYDDNEPEARVKVYVANQTPEGDAIEPGFGVNRHDSDLPVGTTITGSLGTPLAAPLAVYIA